MLYELGDWWQTELGAPSSLFISMSDSLKWIKQQVHSEVEVRKVIIAHVTRHTCSEGRKQSQARETGANGIRSI